MYRWYRGSSNSFEEEGKSCPEADSKGSRDGHYMLNNEGYNNYIYSSIGDYKICMRFQFSAYSERDDDYLQVYSPSGDIRWKVFLEAENSQYKSWTVGQVEVQEYVRFEAHFESSSDGWIAIDNIVFKNSTDCKTIPAPGNWIYNKVLLTSRA